MWDNHIPVTPPLKKKAIKLKAKRREGVIIIVLLSIVRVQFTILTTAGRDIIMVMVLKKALAFLSKPTKYI